MVYNHVKRLSCQYTAHQKLVACFIARHVGLGKRISTCRHKSKQSRIVKGSHIDATVVGTLEMHILLFSASYLFIRLFVYLYTDNTEKERHEEIP